MFILISIIGILASLVHHQRLLHEECVDKMRIEVMLALKHKAPEQKLTLEFRHDVYGFLFNGKGMPAEQRGWMLFEESYFEKCKLPPSWFCIHDQHGDGTKVRFPVKMRTFLGHSPRNFSNKGGEIVELPRSFIEKMSIKFIKIASSCS
jgi:hypothetical protein